MKEKTQLDRIEEKLDILLAKTADIPSPDLPVCDHFWQEEKNSTIPMKTCKKCFQIELL